MNGIDRYLAAVQAALAQVEAQREALETAAGWLSETLQKGGLLYITGSGHSHMLAEEVFYRAGGLAAVYPLLEPSLMLHEGALKSTQMERLSGVAEMVLSEAGVTANDLLLVASNSGRNAYPIEIALAAKSQGCKTIAITSLAHSQAVSSRHESGQRLFELADLVIDNAAPYGDASVDLVGVSSSVGPISTISGVLIINAIVVRAVERSVAAGKVPDIFVSANVQGAETGPDMDFWRQRIRKL